MIDEQTDLSAFFSTTDWDSESYLDWANRIHSTRDSRDEFEQLLRNAREQGGDLVRIGMALAITGRYAEALETFGRSRSDDKARHFFIGRTAATLGRSEDAIEAFRKAASAGWESFETDMEIAIVHIRAGDLDKARKLVDKHAGAGVDRALWQFASGMIREYDGNYVAALEAYERSLALDPDDPRTMFRCAYLYDLHGDDEQGIELYERLALQPAAHVNALMNLAVLYEDRGEFTKAADCLARVLAANPNHVRARLFLKDVESSRTMIIEDEYATRADAHTRQLETPIQEFDLTVRARNCLKKMNINTLGDLLRTSEAELMAYKNFGETTLTEVKELLGKMGLSLGQLEPLGAPPPPAAAAAPAPPPVEVPPGREPMLSKPVSQLELSVRSRKCLQRLNIGTVGELIQRSEQDLLAIRNFGQTSLEEIKGRLGELGLSLASSE